MTFDGADSIGPINSRNPLMKLCVNFAWVEI